MLVHLDRNKLALFACDQNDLYEVMLEIAKGTLSLSPQDRRRDNPPRPTADAEVESLSKWLDRYARKRARGERQVTYRRLRTILKFHGYDFGDSGGNSIGILKRQFETVFFVKKERWSRIGSIGYHSDGSFVPLKELKKVRAMCRLREEDGVDSDSFYDMDETVDAFVNRYRNVLRRLAKT